MTEPRPVPAPEAALRPPLAVVTGAAAEPAASPGWRDWLALMRPRQWSKNMLVAAAPLAAGRWTSAEAITDILFAFAVFTLMAAGCYMVNDVRDVRQDRWHSEKRRRPVAAGRIRPGVAVAVGLTCVVLSPAIAAAFHYPWLALLLVGYAGLALGYSLRLKQVPYLEIAVLAAGFVLRPLAGAAAAGIPTSGWFLAVTCAGAVMVATGKRTSELATAGASEQHRRSLRHYSAAGLRTTQLIAAAVLAGAYVGWAATRPTGELPFAVVSLAAIIGAVARFVIRSRRGDAGAPEDLLLRDRWLLIAATIWIAAMLAGSVRA